MIKLQKSKLGVLKSKISPNKKSRLQTPENAKVCRRNQTSNHLPNKIIKTYANSAKNIVEIGIKI